MSDAAVADALIGPVVSTVAGTGVAGLVDGPAATAQLNTPEDVVADSTGRIFFTDRLNHRIRVFQSGQLLTFAGQGRGYRDGSLGEALFNEPVGLALDASGALYVSDLGNRRIRRIASGVVSTIAGDGTAGYVDGAAASARFRSPYGLVIEASGDLLIADTDNHVIRRLGPTGVATYVGSVQGYADGVLASARLNGPRSLLLDAEGRLLVAEFNGQRLRAVQAGQVTTVAGTGVSGYRDGPTGSAQFHHLVDVVLASDGTIYLSELWGNRIRSIQGGVVGTLAGTGEAGSADGPVATATLSAPRGLLMMPSGGLLVADSGSHRLRMIAPLLGP